MSGSTQRKLKSKIICERALVDVGEGTSARTRPLTYDEIMLKRKSKKELEGSVEDEHELEAARPEENVSNPEFQSRVINEAAKKNPRDHQRESSPIKKVEKGYRTTEHKERRDVEDSRDHQRDFSPRKVGKNPRAEHTHSKIENKERRGVENSRDHQRESSPRKKVEKSSKTEHTHNKIENKERHDVDNSRDQQRESSARKVEKISWTEQTLNKSQDNERRDIENSRDHQRDSSSRRKVEKSSRTEDTHSKGGDIEKLDAENSRDHQRESSPRRKVEKSSKTEHTHSKSENKEKRDAEDPRDHQREPSPRRKVEKSSKTEHTHSKSENKEKRDVDDPRDHQWESCPRRKVEKSSRTEHTHRKSENKEKCGAEDLRDHQLESSPRRKVEKSSRTEHTHSKSENKEKRDAEDRSKHKHDNDMKNASESINDRQGRIRSKAEVQARGDGRDSKYENKHRDSAVQDRNVERNGGASERENKRRDRGGDDEIYRVRDPVKKHDSGSRWGSEISEGKDKTEPSRFDENRSKRRRSRSQERTKEKVWKSSSSSPKAQKVISDHVHDHVEPSLRSERDRSRRHSDVDRTKMPSDGSSSHNRRHGGSSSGLGGYSPRKRKSEAAVKTPSPIRSPDRKSAGWNLPPSGADRNISTAAPGTLPVSQPKPSNAIGLAAGVSIASSMVKPIAAILSNSQSAFKQASIDSVQLTQATRPMRRLYIDNIPGCATEKDIMECFNTFLLSSGSNYIRGAHPCISCMIHKEKGQALVEFLTPEDASAALLFDGRSLSGSILKIRRPKDFVDVPVRSSGSSEKSKARKEPITEVSISNIVKDSPHKIFVGGIAEGLSSEMLMEIFSAFGTLKAYRFEFNEDLKEPCVFLEYADQSVTFKACAGLNCMKLGGKVLTVTQAVPNTESLQESFESCPFYGIPEHVKPLLQKPTQILKLKKVFDEKALDLLSEIELEDIVEDVRLECSRFGSVVSINVVKGGKTTTSISETNDVTFDNKITQPPEERIHHLNVSPTKAAVDHDDGDGRNEESLCTIQEVDATDAVEKDEMLELAPATTNPDIESGAVGITIVEDLKEADKTSAHNCDKADKGPQIAVFGVSTADDMGVENESEGNRQEASIQENVASSELNSNGSFGLEKSANGERRFAEDVSELGKNDDTSQEAVTSSTNLGVTSKVSTVERSCDATDKEFEVGCVLVEFRRMEASCMAAHCLHGRAYDDRIVTVEYVPLKVYRERFPK